MNLIILSEQFRGKKFKLDQPQYSIGRVETCSICINDPTISSHQCILTQSDNSYCLIDNNSTNGTRVNNVPLLSKLELRHGDIIQIGSIELLFENIEYKTKQVMRTQTNININDTVSINVNMTKKRYSIGKKPIYAIIGVLSLIIVFLSILLIHLLK